MDTSGGSGNTKTVSGQTSDGFHTFDELYGHRTALFIALMATNPELSWYADTQSDGAMYDGMFIAGMQLPDGQVTYHLYIDPWLSVLSGSEIDHYKQAPAYDGHSSEDVISRLMQWVANRG